MTDQQRPAVGMGYAVCPVCGKEHDEMVLIERRWIPAVPTKLEQRNFTGFSLCPEHKKLHDDGYIALVVCSYVPEGVPFIEQYNGAKRTGEIMHMRYSMAARVFNMDVSKLPMTWIDPEAAAKIKAMMHPDDAKETKA